MLRLPPGKAHVPCYFSTNSTERGDVSVRARALLQNFRGLSINRPEVAMSLALRNLQRAVPLRRALLRQRLQAVRGALMNTDLSPRDKSVFP